MHYSRIYSFLFTSPSAVSLLTLFLNSRDRCTTLAVIGPSRVALEKEVLVGEPDIVYFEYIAGTETVDGICLSC